MRVIEFSRNRAQPIELFGSTSASSVHLADGRGDAHVYGSGWVAAADGSRVPPTAGQGAFFENGERHSKGSEAGMTVLMVQVSALEPAPPLAAQLGP